MTIMLESISGWTQYPQLEAWYYSADPIFHKLGYGSHASKIIKAHLDADSLFVQRQFLQGIFVNQKLVGFVIIYPVKESAAIHQMSYQYLKTHMSRLGYLRRKKLYRQTAQMLNKAIVDSGYYIHTLTIAPQYQGQGIGSITIDRLRDRYKNQKLSLHVNDQNDRAVKFYLQNRFAFDFHGQMRYQGHYYGEYLMSKI
ncbi:GNAT family N-acetyltransferase [Amphibacillus sp. Q70]|uniref:GNAT family N-acetyltransferase n=1 Tax=Amphibacillus sp. Q70 TaxID=3453416 RepID=UPI003F860EEB